MVRFNLHVLWFSYILRTGYTILYRIYKDQPYIQITDLTIPLVLLLGAAPGPGAQHSAAAHRPVPGQAYRPHHSSCSSVHSPVLVPTTQGTEVYHLCVPIAQCFFRRHVFLCVSITSHLITINHKHKE